MRYARFIASSASLLFAGFILFISLSAGNSKMVDQQGTFESSQKQFYISQTILPDHVAYPVLMAFDKSKLVTASPNDQIFLEIEYAGRRLVYAQELINRENPSLALTTLTKAQKYVLKATSQALATDIPLETKYFALEAAQNFIEKVDHLKPQFSESDHGTIDFQTQELRVIRDQLHAQLGSQS